MDVPIVGRVQELATLHRQLERAASERQLLILEGEAGIGKTRLLHEASRYAKELGFNVFTAAADELEQARPYGLLLTAVRSRRVSGGGQLSELLNQPQTGAADRRLAVIDWIVSFVEESASDAPVVFALDDLHWADTETLQVLRALARRTISSPFALVAASRHAPSNDELERLVGVIESDGSRISLEGLDEFAVSQLVTQLMAQTVTSVLHPRVTSARGNPFFVIEILASGLDDRESADIPPDLRRTVLRRLMHLSDDARKMLRFASLLGAVIDPAELATILGLSGMEVLPMIDDAIKGGVLDERDGSLAFRHDIVREAVYGDMPSSLRRRSHRDVARALAAEGAPARRVAMHFALAAKGRDAEAISWLRRASAEEMQRAPTAAADMLGHAAQLLEPIDPVRGEIQAERVQALAWAGRVAEASALARGVLSDLRDPELAATVRASLGESLFFSGHLADAAEHLELAAADSPATQRGLLLAEAAASRLISGQLQPAAALVAIAQAEADSTGDPRARSLALGVSGLLAVLGGDRAGLDLARGAVKVADEDFLGEAHRYVGRVVLGYLLHEVDSFEEAIDVLREGIRLDESHGVTWALPCYYSVLGVLYFHRGNWDDAVAELETATSVLDDMDSTLFAPLAHGLLAQIALFRDDRVTAERELATGDAELAKTGLQFGAEVLVQTRALLTEDAGDTSGAAAIFRGIWAMADAMGLRLVFGFMASAHVRFSLAEDDHAAARRAVEAVEELSASMRTPTLAGTALLCRGMVEADTSMLLRAVETLRGAGRPFNLAEACEEAAAALARGNQKAQAAALVQEAVAIYEGIGALREVRRASAALGQAAGRRKVAKRRPVSGWGSLSPTERRVVALVADGLTNPTIAEKLVVSRRTVETHVSHLFQKLGVTSRVELALLASRELASAEVQ